MKAFRRLVGRDYLDTEKAQVRLKYCQVASVFGMISNFLLFVLKTFLAYLSGSISIIADATNNLSDVATSVIAFIGFRLTKRPADKEHPFGHARYEYIAGLFVAIFMLLMGVVFTYSSVKKIIDYSQVEYSFVSLIVMFVAVLIKFLQMMLYKDFSVVARSQTLKACANDSRNDILMSFAVLISIAVGLLFKVNIDAYMGLVVAVFIVISSIGLLKEFMNLLLGKAVSNEESQRIKNDIMKYKGVLGLHDLSVHSYGVDKMFAVVHVEVDANESIMESHDLIDRIERDIYQNNNINLTIHMDPVYIDDEVTNKLKEKTMEVMSDICEKMSIHDFRVKKGEHTIVFFDISQMENNVTCLDIENALKLPLYNECKSLGIEIKELKFFINIDIE